MCIRDRRMGVECVPDRQRIVIEQLDPQHHDRRSFACGTARLDNFLKRTARKHHAGDFTRVWVATDGHNPRILGYYALNAHSLEGHDLPADLTHKAPPHGSIPAVYLSMIAVDRRQQGKGLGRILLADALARAAAAAERIGIKAVVLDVIEDGESTEKRRAFYTTMGFEPLPGRPLRMFMSMDTVRLALAPRHAETVHGEKETDETESL